MKNTPGTLRGLVLAVLAAGAGVFGCDREAGGPAKESVDDGPVYADGVDAEGFVLALDDASTPLRLAVFDPRSGKVGFRTVPGQRAFDPQVGISPDGERIAMWAETDGAWAIHVVRLVLGAEGPELVDEQVIAVTDGVGDGELVRGQPRFNTLGDRIWVSAAVSRWINLETGAVASYPCDEAFDASPERWEGHPGNLVPSPDGRHYSLQCPGLGPQLYDDGELRLDPRLSGFFLVGVPAGGVTPWPLFTADGQWLVLPNQIIPDKSKRGAGGASWYSYPFEPPSGGGSAIDPVQGGYQFLHVPSLTVSRHLDPGPNPKDGIAFGFGVDPGAWPLVGTAGEAAWFRYGTPRPTPWGSILGSFVDLEHPPGEVDIGATVAANALAIEHTWPYTGGLVGFGPGRGELLMFGQSDPSEGLYRLNPDGGQQGPLPIAGDPTWPSGCGGITPSGPWARSGRGRARPGTSGCWLPAAWSLATEACCTRPTRAGRSAATLSYLKATPCASGPSPTWPRSTACAPRGWASTPT